MVSVSCAHLCRQPFERIALQNRRANSIVAIATVIAVVGLITSGCGGGSATPTGPTNVSSTSNSARATVAAIWSEQWSDGRSANFLPGGAGTRGNADSYVLLGARPDGTIHAGATISLSPEIDRSSIEVRMARLEPGGSYSPPVGMGTIAGDTVSIRMSPESFGDSDTVTDYFVLVLQGGEILASSHPYHFKPIFRARYNQAYFTLAGGVRAGAVRGLPIAASFLEAFISGTAPPGASPEPSSVTADTLSHAVGVNFTTPGAGAQGQVALYRFRCARTPCEQGIATAISTSNEMRRLITSSLRGSCFDPSDQPLRLPRSISFNENDPDLGLAFGSATLDGGTLRIVGDRVFLSGTVVDLYDFDFDATAQNTLVGLATDPMGASLQAGHGTIDRYGAVFRVAVELNNPVAIDVCQNRGPGLTGTWLGTYSWTCDTPPLAAGVGLVPIRMDIVDTRDGFLSGSVSYLGGSATMMSSWRLRDAQLDDKGWLLHPGIRDPNGDVAHISWSWAPTPNISPNSFVGTITGDRLVGVTLNGDGMHSIYRGCSLSTGPAGRIEVVRQP